MQSQQGGIQWKKEASKKISGSDTIAILLYIFRQLFIRCVHNALGVIILSTGLSFKSGGGYKKKLLIFCGRIHLHNNNRPL